MTDPSFSVVIPLYNKRDFVVEAVTSAAMQEPRPIEVIVVDDGSTDDGPSLVEGLGLPGVRLIRQANAGVSAARNAGIDAARGNWIAFLDADDLFKPGHLKALGDLARRFPSAGMLATGYCRLSSDGKRQPVALDMGPALLDDFHGRWSRLTFTFTSAIGVRAAVMRERGVRFPVGERLGEDQDVWLRLAELAPVAYVGSTLVDYRIEVSGSATAVTPKPAELLPCYKRLNERLAAGQVPTALRPGARRLVGSHWLNTAWALHGAGRSAAAWALWRDPAARGNARYWVRTALQWLAGAVRPIHTQGR